MARIKMMKFENELYYSVRDVLTILDGAKDLNEVIDALSIKEIPIEDEFIELSDFNKKLKKGLDYNPKDKK